MKKILICTDGSIYAQSVYDHSVWAARQTGASVHVLHMLNPHRERAEFSSFTGNLGPNTGEDLLVELVELEETKNRLAREEGKLIIEGAKEYLKSVGVNAPTAEQQHGSLVEAVTEIEHDYDLVVIGKRGKAADFAKGHLGSNLERVIRGTKKPVLVTARRFEPIERCLIAYDGGPSVEKAIQFLQAEPLLKGVKLFLVRAGTIDSKAEWYLGEAADKLRTAGYEVESEAIPGNPEKAIAEAVERHHINLLVMGAYGHSRIRQLFVGSTTTAMVRTCKIPVIMFT